MAGEGVEYVFTNSRHTNPIYRVTREMLLEAAETVLGYFGFDKSLYGDSPKKNKKWWHELWNWRVQDIENEKS